MRQQFWRRYWQLGGSAAQLVVVVIAAQFDTIHAWRFATPCLAGISLLSWLLALRHVRAVVDNPTSKVASAAQGYVELEGRGRALDGPSVFAQLSATPCLWFRYRVDVRDGNKWRTESSGVSDASFILDDGSAVCLVDPEGAEVLTEHHQQWTEANRRYSEWRIHADESIYALGHFVTRTASEGLDINADMRLLLAEWKQDPARLAERFDLNRDGEIDLQEWELARAQARREVLVRHRTLSLCSDTHLMHAPPDGRLYLLASIPPDAIARRYRRWAGFHLACFFAAIVGLAYVWDLM